jgi:hypothetical protein
MEVAQLRAVIHRELEAATEVRAAAADEAVQARDEAQRELDAARELRAAATREAQELLGVAERETVEMREAARHSLTTAREARVQASHDLDAAREVFATAQREVQVPAEPEAITELPPLQAGNPEAFPAWETEPPVDWGPAPGEEGQIDPPDLMPEARERAASEGVATDEGDAVSRP